MKCSLVTVSRKGDGYEHYPTGKAIRDQESTGSAGLDCALRHLTSYAETYVAGQVGMTFPQALSSGEVTQHGIGDLDLSDQPLKNSLMLGAKLGHYFTKAPWVGIETGLSFANPHVKEGSLTLSGPGGSATFNGLSGLSHRMIIWDVATLMFRYPGHRLQPYVGVGPALYFARLKGSEAPGWTVSHRYRAECRIGRPLLHHP